MIFSILVIVLFLIIAFFHYVQGFFSATISAMLCVLSAALAVSYNETVINWLLKGKLPDHMHAISLCLLFVVSYFIMRMIFDAAIPGNVMVPGTIEKIGAGLMGIVAAIFVTGIFAIAVQMLPFDPGMSFMGASRYAVHDDPENPNVNLPSPGGGQSKDTSIYSQMDETTMDPTKEKGLLLPVDDWVLDTVYHLSDGGALAGDRSLASIHPDYLQELFGERLGIQIGARHAALYSQANGSVSVTDIFTAKSFPAGDGQVKALRPKGYKPLTEIKPGAGEMILVIRVKVGANATDDPDQTVRFSTGSIHLVGANAQGVFKDYYPVGMLESGTTVLVNKPDDFLFVAGDKSFDAVFVVDSALVTPGKPADTIAAGVSLSFKRTAILDLQGQAVKSRIDPSADVQLIRNKLVTVPPPSAAPSKSNDAAASPAPAPSADNTTPAAAAPQAPPAVAQPTPGKDLSDPLSVTAGNAFLAPGSIALGTTSADPDAKDAPVKGGSMTLKGGLIFNAKVDPANSISSLGEGVQGGSQFFAPTDRTIVQAVVHPYQANWDWVSQLSATALIDGNGNTYPISGFYVITKAGDVRGLFLRYDSAHALASVSPPDGSAEGDIYLVFLIPHETDIKTLKMGSKQQNLDSPLHVQ